MKAIVKTPFRHHDRIIRQGDEITGALAQQKMREGYAKAVAEDRPASTSGRAKDQARSRDQR